MVTFWGGGFLLFAGFGLSQITECAGAASESVGFDSHLVKHAEV